MDIVYDKQADALFIWFNSVTSEKTIDITNDIFVDIDKFGKLAGIEVIHASEKVNLTDLLTLTLKLFPQNKEFKIQVPDMLTV